MNLGQRLADSRETNGFNRIRLIAALLVLISHAFPITGAVEPLRRIGVNSSLGFLSVAAFFVISGLLVSMSYERSALLRFVEKRVLRILPALIVSVVVCVLLLGPLVTTSPDYFKQPQTWLYFARILFVPVNHDLPGVFQDHPNTAVNGNLWSLGFEVICYIGVAVALLLPYRRPMIILAWLTSFLVARLVPEDARGAMFYAGTLAELFRFFGAGMLFYLYRDKLPIRADLAWASAALVALGALTPAFHEICAVAGSYALVALACLWRPLHVSGESDYSYGVYVYAFPAQQLVYHLTGSGWVLNILLALPVTVLLAAFSWHLIEKPAMRLRLFSRPSVRQGVSR
jgi:peptidoglycan/LPS O-acetylase OafA/YrhL